jgi:hypothetical protein
MGALEQYPQGVRGKVAVLQGIAAEGVGSMLPSILVAPMVSMD